jgi:hypothetical protein
LQTQSHLITAIAAGGLVARLAVLSGYGVSAVVEA